ncbi:hypothetical protein [Oceanobacillus jeddahense]|uniref:hypothetical protein n=1 Tax=Oceanobacillus jeddahense TaxID=1462527 RepID=UPI000595FAAF|nr:hypothetical protein [Oceanobacillus jeddahense]
MITKDIYISGDEYLLILETDQAPYKAELYKRDNKETKYISQNHFMGAQEISAHLRGWILSAAYNFNKNNVFKSIIEWDGVIE